MYTVYVLRSRRNGRRYVGFTAKTSKERLDEHNLGSSKWTRANRPFILIYEEHFAEATEARRREKFLKSGKGRQYLNNKIPR